ncbi:MAG TPA: VWA domain-containing protein [Ferruginibacter sp.]|nr:VWA domain-containing protein [Ferruginibacter sp.]HRO16955.1 VWA domain-containing protein [Ferruginibacter sp.]HRQ21508.1 VWA domain-containing protein [Ferruginibacter sp.]
MILRYFEHIEFAYPQVFWLLLLLPLCIFWYARTQLSSKASIPVSTLNAGKLSSLKSNLLHLPFILRLLMLTGVIMAGARPQVRNVEEHAVGEGIDIVLCIDVSGSMTARDFLPNRLEAAKQVATTFVQKRKTDRIGVVIFSGESFTMCPITGDYPVVLSSIQNIRNGMLEDGTAIGSGLSTSVDRLRGTDAKSKVVLLLTDGVNNGGLIDPNTAKEIAKAFGVRVYTIGVGSEGYAPQPVQTPLGVVMQQEKVNIDETLLTQIANETGGKYFRAKDNEELNEIYSSIDELEKSKVELVKNVRYQDVYFPILAGVLLLFMLEMLLNYTVFRKFP